VLDLSANFGEIGKRTTRSNCANPGVIGGGQQALKNETGLSEEINSSEFEFQLVPNPCWKNNEYNLDKFIMPVRRTIALHVNCTEPFLISANKVGRSLSLFIFLRLISAYLLQLIQIIRLVLDPRSLKGYVR